MAAALRQRVVSPSTTTSALPSLTLPPIALPQFNLPKIHRLAPLPPAVTGTPAAGTAAPATPQRIPVITDRHSLTSASKPAAAAKADPFSKVPTVVDTVGAPTPLSTAT